MKALYIGLGILSVGAVGYLVYKKMTGPQTGTYSVSPYSYPNDAYQNAYVGGQPSEQYPYRAITPPRVDNSNQPWYGGSRQLATSASSNLSSGMDLNFQKNMSYITGASEMIGSLRSMWDDLELGSFFESSSKESSWDTEGFNWNELEFV